MRDIILTATCKTLLAAKEWSEDDRTIILNTFCNLIGCSQDKLLEMLLLVSIK